MTARPAAQTESLPDEHRHTLAPNETARRLRPLLAALVLLGALICPPAGNAAPAPVPPPLLLAETDTGQVDPADYWVSEKLDGVRALWDGRQLYFRSGRPVHAPDWFVRGLPAGQALDGELWLGRGRFDALSGIVRRQQPVDAEWRQVRFMVFELPGAAGDFSARLHALRAVVDGSGVGWLSAVEQYRVADRAALQARLAEVLRAGGEGLMLHRADAPYLSGRNPALLKVKPWLDAEATVIGHEAGRGRHRGRLGALRVENADGRRFRIGTGFSDAERERPPPIGSTVTYRYRELNRNGLPRFASYWRMRQEF